MRRENGFIFHPPLEGEGRTRRVRGGVMKISDNEVHPLPTGYAGRPPPSRGR